MKVQMWRLDRVKPYEANPRINDKSVAAVAASIREFGFRQPIVVDWLGVIIAGHTRWKAAHELGLEKVPVHVVAEGELSPEKIRAYRIADNKTNELASWDKDLLRAEMAALSAVEFDLNLLAYTDDELQALLGESPAEAAVDPDAVPDLPAEPTSRAGSLWALGDHRLLCGNSALEVDVDRLVAGQAMHLIHSDPPYNVNVEPRSKNGIAAGNSSFPSAGAANGPMRAKDRKIENDCMSDEAFAACLAAWFGNMARVLEPGRSFYLWGGYANVASYPPALEAAGMYFSQAIIWVKQHPVMGRKDFMGNHEWCFYGWREGAGHVWLGPKNVPDVWEISKAGAGVVHPLNNGIVLRSLEGGEIGLCNPPADPSRVLLVEDQVQVQAGVSDLWFVKKMHSSKTVHLTEKPVELASRAIRWSSRPGENVLDLFGGSGSTLAAAELLGRRAFLMELDPAYCDVIVQRWENLTGKTAILLDS